jgi:hypothetical protein
MARQASETIFTARFQYFVQIDDVIFLLRSRMNFLRYLDKLM